MAIDGVTCIKQEKYCLFHIQEFTDGMKAIIREELASICYGEETISLGRQIYSYRETIKEFMKRYDDKTPELQEGQIGELLTHILVRHYFEEYEVVTPFFNMVERSIKKGYDVVLTEKQEAKIWIVEVKSGQLHKNKDSNQTMQDLINAAKNDLKKRLNEGNLSLWQEAINGARLAYNSNRNLKGAVVDLLMQYGEEATKDNSTSRNKNVFLSGVLFAELSDKVVEKTPKDKQTGIEKEGIFGNTYIVSLQKHTYELIYKFLRDEINEERDYYSPTK